MQLPTHLITGVLIDKAVKKWRLPEPLRLAITAVSCYLSHGILDKTARATYHPPDPLDDHFWSGYHRQVLPGLTYAIMLKYAPRHAFAMVFAALPDVDWLLRGVSQKFGSKIRRLPDWNGPVLNEGLHSFFNHVPLVRRLNQLPDLRYQRKGVLVEMGLVAAIFVFIHLLDRRKA